VRCMLEELCSMDDMLAKLIKETGMEEVESVMIALERNLDRVRSVIESLPRGMTKERFVGGISKFYNMMYLLKEAIKKIKNS